MIFNKLIPNKNDHTSPTRSNNSTQLAYMQSIPTQKNQPSSPSHPIPKLPEISVNDVTISTPSPISSPIIQVQSDGSPPALPRTPSPLFNSNTTTTSPRSLPISGGGWIHLPGGSPSPPPPQIPQFPDENVYSSRRTSMFRSSYGNNGFENNTSNQEMSVEQIPSTRTKVSPVINGNGGPDLTNGNGGPDLTNGNGTSGLSSPRNLSPLRNSNILTPNGNFFFRPLLKSKSQRTMYNASISVSRGTTDDENGNEVTTEALEQEEMKDSLGSLGMTNLSRVGDSPISSSNSNSKGANGKSNSSKKSPSSLSAPKISISGGSSAIVKEKLPIDVKIIIDSRPSGMTHNLNRFDGLQYTEFWHVTSEEAKILMKWSPLEFHRQNAIFEFFILLRKLRINLKRMVSYYGPTFRDAKNLTPNHSADYQKTFLPLEALFNYLEKLVNRRLKPAYDNHFFVNDFYVLGAIKAWVLKLETDYEYISRSMVYLAKISATESVKTWIEKVEREDPYAIGNQYLASAKSLFLSYFLQVFAPIRLMSVDLIKLYRKLDDEELISLASEIRDSLNRINTISEYTTNLDTKINLNEKLLCTDYLYLEMVDLFNKDRKLRVPIELHLKSSNSWDNAILYLLDNYLLPLTKGGSSKAPIYTLSRPPISLQYMSFEDKVDEPIKYLTIRDSGNMITHLFKYDKVEQPQTFTNFVKDFDIYKTELFKKLNNDYELKLVNGTSFQSLPSDKPDRPMPPIQPKELDPVSNAIQICKFKPNSMPPITATNVLSIDCFLMSDQLMFLVGASDGLYLGKPDQPTTWKKISDAKNVKKISIIDHTMCFFQSEDQLYQVMVSALVNTYLCDVPCTNKFALIDKRVSGYEIGSQQVKQGPYLIISAFIFYWKEKKIMFSQVTKERNWKLKFQSMKATFNVQSLQFLYPTDFVITHINESNPIFYISNLTTMANTQLHKTDEDKDFKSRLRNQKPVATFKFPLEDNKSPKDYDLILVYSRCCMFVNFNRESQSYQRSRNEIIRFGFDCVDAVFDPVEKSLILVGAENVEIWSISQDRRNKSELISCFVGSKLRVLNRLPGKVILSLMDINDPYGLGNRGNQLILHLRRKKQ